MYMNLTLNKCQLIWQSHKHNAFTDLTEYKGRFYCCFREAQNHVSKDGIIRILVSNDLINWKTASLLRQANSDFRDPKLTVHPSGKLTLLYYHKRFDHQGRNYLNQNCMHFSLDGISWSGAHILGERNWWLWRIRYFKDTALGIAYNRAQNRVKLYQGDPLRGFNCRLQSLFSLAENGKAYPNESDITFLEDGTAICILRRDADSYTAQLGIAKPGYTSWKWFDLAEYLGGPAVLQLKNGKIIIAARRILWPFKLKTWLFELDLAQKQIAPLLELPSAGDNSYPAMLEKNNKLYISFYSQHRINRNNQLIKKLDTCAIYLAEVSL